METLTEMTRDKFEFLRIVTEILERTDIEQMELRCEEMKVIIDREMELQKHYIELGLR